MTKHNGAFWYLTGNERRSFPHESRNKTQICGSNIVAESHRQGQRNLMNPRRFFIGENNQGIGGKAETIKKTNQNK